jgi:hypothetical protein
MLHRQEPAELIVITQPTHAWISGCLARAWGNEDFGSFVPTEEVCLSAEQHDIGWLLWESTPTLNPKTGYPHSFMEVPTQVHIGIWSGAKRLALSFGRYVALLVSLHGTGLYERYTNWQKSPESSQIVQEFLEYEYAFQEKLIATLQNDLHYAPYVTSEVIKRNRSLIAIWDLLSLALCQGLRHEQQFNQVPTASGETTLTLTPVDDDPMQVKVAPWPFQESEVTLVYEGRILREKFTDETVMRAALVDADCVTITTILSPKC